jgi:hypothetical protein
VSDATIVAITRTRATGPRTSLIFHIDTPPTLFPASPSQLPVLCAPSLPSSHSLILP